jgi:hypothetical protein
MAAPEGNTNSSKSNRLWGDTIRRAIAQSDPDKLRRIAESLLNKAEEGDLQAIKELGDRLDGKAAQTIMGDKENPLAVRFMWGND